MIQSGRSRCWKLSVASYLVMGGAITLTGCFAIASLGDCALAQIIPDITLGMKILLLHQQARLTRSMAEQLEAVTSSTVFRNSTW
jgi:hypothetical protein